MYSAYKNERHNFNNMFRLDYVCATDYLRPAIGFVHFIGGYAYATDAHILIRAKIADISNFTANEIKTMCAGKGMSISASAFRRVIQYRNVDVTPEGFLHKSDDGEMQQIFKLHPIDDERKMSPTFWDDDKCKVPDFDSIIDRKPETEGIKKIGLDVSKFNDVCRAMGTERVGLYFTSEQHQIQLKSLDKELQAADIVAIIMPVLIDY